MPYIDPGTGQPVFPGTAEYVRLAAQEQAAGLYVLQQAQQQQPQQRGSGDWGDWIPKARDIWNPREPSDPEAFERAVRGQWVWGVLAVFFVLAGLSDLTGGYPGGTVALLIAMGAAIGWWDCTERRIDLTL